jgi:hypothetical protein
MQEFRFSAYLANTAGYSGLGIAHLYKNASKWSNKIQHQSTKQDLLHEKGLDFLIGTALW